MTACCVNRVKRGALTGLRRRIIHGKKDAERTGYVAKPMGIHRMLAQ